MATKFTSYEKDRQDLELKWLKNRRQFRGEYDNEIKALLNSQRSQVYPKLTRSKVIGMVARLMDLLFPQTAKNWNIKPTPFPNIAQADLQTVINQLQQVAQSGQLTDEMIEKAVDDFAAKRCLRMEKTIQDQLADSKLDYITLVRKVVFSSVCYGVGVLKGPLVRRGQKRTWQQNANNQYQAVTVPVVEPYYEFVPLWGFYPDLTAKTRDQMDGAFERHIFSRHELRALADRSDFFDTPILEYIKNNPTGNFKEKTFEGELRGEKNTTDSNVVRTDKKYEVIEWWGFITAQELKAIGLDIGEADMADDLSANVWILDGTVIKAVLSPLPPDVKMYHLFVYEEDDTSLLGNGMPEVIRESQLAVCSAARMVLDNGSVVCGPMFEVNTEILDAQTNTDIYAFKVFGREGTGQEANIPAVKEISVNSHIAELTGIIELFKGFADTESLLPPSLQGDMTAQGKEPFRTAQNTSQLFGAAALPIRDVVRNFDQFTESVIGSLYYWNMKFNIDAEIKGDFQVQAEGSTSLIAKEVRSQALNNVATTLSPEDKDWVNEEEFLKERFLAMDLPVDRLILSKEEHDAKMQSKQQQAAAAQKLQDDQTIAKTKETMTKALLNVANAEATEAKVQLDAHGKVLETATVMNELQQPAEQPQQGAPNAAQ
jgi:hypothetical protein